MLTKLWGKKDVYRENFNKELENIRKTQSEMKNSIVQSGKQNNGIQ